MPRPLKSQDAPAIVGLEQLPPREQRTYQRVIFSKSDKNADATVPAVLNGQFFRYPRGVECLVPNEVIDVLNNAVIRNIDTTDGTATIETEEQAYTFQIKGVASPSEVAEHFAQ